MMAGARRGRLCRRLDLLGSLLLHRSVLVEVLLRDLRCLRLQILLQLEVARDLVLGRLGLGEFDPALRLEVFQPRFVEQELLMQVLDLCSQVGVGLADGVHELHPVRQVPQRGGP